MILFFLFISDLGLSIDLKKKCKKTVLALAIGSLMAWLSQSQVKMHHTKQQIKIPCVNSGVSFNFKS